MDGQTSMAGCIIYYIFIFKLVYILVSSRQVQQFCLDFYLGSTIGCYLKKVISVITFCP